MTPTKRPFVFRAARFGFNFVRSRDFRSVALLRWRDPPNLFQPFTDSFRDRYPQLFRFVRQEIGDAASQRILSFGCSTGDEVFTLREYFPLSWIKGIDINARNVRAARRRLKRSPDGKITFEVASTTVGELSNSYNAIFCMAVFRHGGLGASGRDGRCDHLIRFQQFEETVGEIARCLVPGGLLLIGYSNFRFSETRIATNFDVVFQADASPDAQTPIFDRDNRFLAQTGYGEIGFRKRV
jgi:SAM-dependent methyltransferase